MYNGNQFYWRCKLKKLTTYVLPLLAITTCFGFWYHKSDLEQIRVHMNQAILIEQADVPSEFIASTNVDIENFSEELQDAYQLGVEVKLYDGPDCNNEITHIAEYEVQDMNNIRNGTHPMQVKIKIKEDAKMYDELQVVMFAQLEKKNI